MLKTEFADEEIPEAGSNEYMQGDQFDPDAELVFDQPEIMPEGFYAAKLVDIQSAGGPTTTEWYCNYYFVVTEEGEWRNKSLPQFLTFIKEGKVKNVQWINDDVLRALKAREIPHPTIPGRMQWKAKPSELLGRAVILYVIHNTWEGRTTAKIKKVLPPDERAEELAENFVI
jgi:hypothetical protein